jgi:hypothetical protein
VYKVKYNSNNVWDLINEWLIKIIF